jgi:hypothetical protein
MLYLTNDIRSLSDFKRNTSICWTVSERRAIPGIGGCEGRPLEARAPGIRSPAVSSMAYHVEITRSAEPVT